MLAVFRSRRMAIISALGFASGLPRYLMGPTLVAWMASVHVDLDTIGVFAAVTLPYTFKWAWAPLFDRVAWPWLGRRRGWMLVLQLALVAAIAAIGLTDPRGAPAVVAVAAVVLATLSASQDAVLDAFVAETLGPDERAAGSAAYVLGYRIALVVAGSGALAVADLAPWSVVYLTLAALMAVSTIATLLADEPTAPAPPRTLSSLVVPLRELVSGPGAAAMLAVVALYGVGEQIAAHMMPGLLRGHLHFRLSTIALVSQTAGIAGVIAGGALTGALAGRVDRRRALAGFGAAAAAANLGYSLLALHGASTVLYATVLFVDQTANTMAGAASVAFLMAQCDPRTTATQYALLTALAGVGAKLLGFGAGPLVRALGWPGFFAASAAMVVPAMVAVALVPRARFAVGSAPA